MGVTGTYLWSVKDNVDRAGRGSWDAHAVGDRPDPPADPNQYAPERGDDPMFQPDDYPPPADRGS